MIYLASPYTSPHRTQMQARYDLVERATADLLAKSYIVFSPIVHCHHLAQKYSLPADFKFWQTYNLGMLDNAWALWVLTIPGWEDSAGVQEEVKYATSLLKPVSYFSMEDICGKDYYNRAVGQSG